MEIREEIREKKERKKYWKEKMIYLAMKERYI